MNERQLFSLHVSIEFEWRVFHFRNSPPIPMTIILICIIEQVLAYWECSNHTSVMKVKWIGHSRNTTVWVSAPLSIYIYIYMNIYWLWITVWGEVQIRIGETKKGEKKRDKSGRMNEKQIWWSWWFILLLSEAHSDTNKVIEMKKINVTLKPHSFIFHRE